MHQPFGFSCGGETRVDEVPLGGKPEPPASNGHLLNLWPLTSNELTGASLAD